ncbi:hypothetical protein JQS43_25755 [Natronosporangium hydrolyticum]|uniref:NfeD-like C-terminal domain-containing protein n=1 Tax=Natronosporangium hydrolyticum TaxID=2811111 RepID=A0A895YAJ5_9ACTN|nr:hypothetical protein [Natronosporangium hydrolyticum]QSB14804.1 hypothetical protein JQS43_25755 [Natronosporangium hydrolyticum]
MAAMTVLFLIIGGVGVLLLALGLLGVELLDIEGFVPVEVVAAGLGAFGFAAAIASASLDQRPLPALLAAGGIGVVAAIPAGWLTLRLTRAAQHMATDATPTTDDLPGMLAVVITPIPLEGYGEVRLMLGGQPVKFSATADTAVPLGAEVFVISARSETSVFVEPLPTQTIP